eukprot:3643065-Amphidinium_carterae.1
MWPGCISLILAGASRVCLGGGVDSCTGMLSPKMQHSPLPWSWFSELFYPAPASSTPGCQQSTFSAQATIAMGPLGFVDEQLMLWYETRQPYVLEQREVALPPCSRHCDHILFCLAQGGSLPS